MALIYVGIGSNIDKERHILAALTDLDNLFTNIRVSPIFESEAVNCSGANYYNLVVEFKSTMSVSALQQTLKSLEIKHGRKATDKRYAPRTLDLDILLVDDLIQTSSPILPRPEILENAFVLWPLAELAPDLLHPQLGIAVSELWQAFDKSSQQLMLAPLQWQNSAKAVDNEFIVKEV